jgi:predicted signal transduction protein with EAL and GGDEF domain
MLEWIGQISLAFLGLAIALAVACAFRNAGWVSGLRLQKKLSRVLRTTTATFSGAGGMADSDFRKPPQSRC